jgi:hypothetical protein
VAEPALRRGVEGDVLILRLLDALLIVRVPGPGTSIPGADRRGTSDQDQRDRENKENPPPTEPRRAEAQQAESEARERNKTGRALIRTTTDYYGLSVCEAGVLGNENPILDRIAIGICGLVPDKL